MSPHCQFDYIAIHHILTVCQGLWHLYRVYFNSLWPWQNSLRKHPMGLENLIQNLTFHHTYIIPFLKNLLLCFQHLYFVVFFHSFMTTCAWHISNFLNSFHSFIMSLLYLRFIYFVFVWCSLSLKEFCDIKPYTNNQPTNYVIKKYI